MKTALSIRYSETAQMSGYALAEFVLIEWPKIRNWIDENLQSPVTFVKVEERDVVPSKILFQSEKDAALFKIFWPEVVRSRPPSPLWKEA